MKGANSMLVAVVMILAPLVRAEDKNLRMFEVKTGSRVTVYAELKNLSDITVDFSADLHNMKSDRHLPLRLEFSSAGRHPIASFTPINVNREWQYYWSYDWTYGRNIHQKPKPYLYRFPFASGRYTVSQGPFGLFSHRKGSGDEEAIDFRMPTGTPICAARPGVVVGVRSESTKGAPEKKYLEEDNYVIVRHNDGTFAEYIHLQHNGVVVKLGQSVKEGQVIGRSGNTGFSSEPHLHFDVFYTLSGTKRITVPLRFRGRDGKAIAPRQDRSYG